MFTSFWSSYPFTAPVETLAAQLHKLCSQVTKPKTTAAVLLLYTSLQLPAAWLIALTLLQVALLSPVAATHHFSSLLHG